MTGLPAPSLPVADLEVESLAPRVVAPEIAKDIKQLRNCELVVLLVLSAETVTIALPEAPIVAVTARGVVIPDRSVT